MKRETPTFCTVVLFAFALACAGSPEPGILASCPTGDRPSMDLDSSSAPARVAERDVPRGGMLWARECARCHARLVFERDSRLFRNYPRLDCPDFLANVSDRYLQTVISKGGEAVGLEKTMKPFEDKLSPDEIADLVAFIRAVERRVED